MSFNLEKIQQLITDTATEELLPRFQHTSSRKKADGSLITSADLAIQQRIGDALSQLHPEIPFLGEEMSAEDQQRVMKESATGFWCLDPLDGTANFVAGMPCFAISLAYLKHGEPQLGCIYDPMRDEFFHAQAGKGAFLNGARLELHQPVGILADAIAMVDFKRLPPALATHMATSPPFRSQRSIGSVALDWCWLAAGRLQLYLHGGQRLWDYAAGRLIFAEAGGVLNLSDRLDPLEQYTLDLQPKIAIGAVNQALFKLWSTWIKQNSS